MNALVYWRGRLRLRRGFCPACDSSPPDLRCFVCHGTDLYGAHIMPVNRQLWRERWDAAR